MEKQKSTTSRLLKGVNSKRIIKNTTELLENFAHPHEAAQIDLVNDLNKEFFENSSQLIQYVSQHMSNFLAIKFKYYVDILYRMHGHYLEEVQQNRSIRDQVQMANEKLRLALDTTAISEDMLVHMREALGEAWRTADEAQLREEVSRDNHIEKEAGRLKSIQTLPQENSKTTAIGGAVFRERDRLAAELKDHEKRLEANRLYAESLEAIIAAQRETYNRQQLEIKVTETENFKLEHKLRVQHEGLEEKRMLVQKELMACKQRLRELQHYEEAFHKSKQVIEALRVLKDRVVRENFNIQKTFNSYEDDKKQQNLTIAQLRKQVKWDTQTADQLRANLRKALQDLKHEANERHILNGKFQILTKKNCELNDNMILLNNEISACRKELHAEKIKYEDLHHLKEDIQKKRDKLHLDLRRQQDEVFKIKHDAALQRNHMDNLRVDLDKANVQLNDAQLKMQKIRKEKNDLHAENYDLHDQIETLGENLENKSERVLLLLESLQNKQQEFMSVKKQREVVHAEKVTLQRHLEACTHDRQTLHSINAKLSHEVQQLLKIQAIGEKHIQKQRIQIEQINGALRLKISEYQNQERLLQRTRNDYKNFKILFEQAQITIERDERRFKTMTHQMDEVRKEKTLVGLQMVRRNDEMRLLTERIDIMQSALDRGTQLYNQRIEDIRLLKMEIINLRMSNDCLRRAIESTANMRHEVVRLERQLNRERLRVSAVTEEMSRPCRLHRWRIMLCKDPNRFELIRKIQVLLKRNIKLNLARVNIAHKLEEVERMYKALKHQLKFLPDPKVKHRLCIQQRINRKQDIRLKVLKAQLSVTENDILERNCVIDYLKQLLKDHESEIFLDPKSEQLVKQILKMSSSYDSVAICRNVSNTRPRLKQIANK